MDKLWTQARFDSPAGKAVQSAYVCLPSIGFQGVDELQNTGTWCIPQHHSWQGGGSEAAGEFSEAAFRIAPAEERFLQFLHRWNSPMSTCVTVGRQIPGQGNMGGWGMVANTMVANLPFLYQMKNASGETECLELVGYQVVPQVVVVSKINQPVKGLRRVFEYTFCTSKG